MSIVGFIRGITDRKQMEEKILQSEKLKAMCVMTSGITHEFNNILAIIKGFTLLLKEKYGDHKEVIDKLETKIIWIININLIKLILL